MAFNQDIADANTYARLAMPVLGIGSRVSYSYLQMRLPYVAENAQVIGILDSGHYLFEEKPAQVLAAVLFFLKAGAYCRGCLIRSLKFRIFA